MLIFVIWLLHDVCIDVVIGCAGLARAKRVRRIGRRSDRGSIMAESTAVTSVSDCLCAAFVESDATAVINDCDVDWKKTKFKDQDRNGAKTLVLDHLTSASHVYRRSIEQSLEVHLDLVQTTKAPALPRRWALHAPFYHAMANAPSVLIQEQIMYLSGVHSNC